MKPKEIPRKNTRRNDSPGPVITLFVYGTLKRGLQNHDRFCRNAIDIQPATVWGCLYDLGAYPALQVPEESILAYGTADPRADAATQARFMAKIFKHPDPLSEERILLGWGLVRGELMTFDDPAERLPRLDHLEGYHPDGPSIYRRVLTPVFCGNASVTAWVYIADKRQNLLKARLNPYYEYVV